MPTFKEMGLSPNILQALGDLGFEKPTEVQEKAIPFVINSDTDLIALAQTGTGKTAAFSLPLLHKIDPDASGVQALVLCPTRELCIQITKDIQRFLKYERALKFVAVYGGAPIDTQIRQLRKGCQVVVGTPGRVRDLIKRRKLDLSSIQYLVLDEADEMLTMGFKEELDAILASTPTQKQALLFSATMPREIDAIANNYMQSPHKIEIGSRNIANADVKHVFCVTRGSDRYSALKRIVDISQNIYAIIFCRTRAETKEVADHLMADGYQADALHGDLSQAQRDYVMGRFRKKNLQLLVATDVAARGIDVNDLTHVLHFKIPDQLENYIHRSGRTGRAGKKGTSIALITNRESHKIRMLEKKIGQSFERRLIPTSTQVCERKLVNLIQKIANYEPDESIETYMPTVTEQLGELSKEAILKKFVSLEFNKVLKYYKNAPDLNAGGRDGGRDKKKREKVDRTKDSTRIVERDANFARFYINVGLKHKLTASRMIGLVNDSLGIRGIEIGKIEILRGFSFFEIEAEYEDRLIQGFRKGMQVAGVQVVVEKTKDNPQRMPPKRGSKKFANKTGSKHKSSKPRFSKDRKKKKRY
jgi:ATP-dependent RNA helicase DeaD